ncbi:uncharacterized protein VTP21DRAFT_5812 [Calcarisporiella thermophila]|uniref:uncharacterized protein n=1 Tax=Calcarisporiella thermophila TaxID=911321 RepID=UPI003743CCCF
MSECEPFHRITISPIAQYKAVIPPSFKRSHERLILLKRRLPDWKDIIFRQLSPIQIQKDCLFGVRAFGREYIFRIDDAKDTNDQTSAKISYIDREMTILEISKARVHGIEQTRSCSGYEKEFKELSNIIETAFRYSSAQQRLSNMCIKSAIVSGVAGVGKKTLINAVSSNLKVSTHVLSIAEIFSCHELDEDKFWKSMNPIRQAFNIAYLMSPSIILIKDLDLFALENRFDSNFRTAALDALIRCISELEKGDDIFVIGLSRDRARLPEILRNNELFQSELNIPIPSRLQREEILKTLLRRANLKDSARDGLAMQISQATSGFVPADLVKLCRNALLGAMRNQLSPRPTDTVKNQVDKLEESFSQLTLSDLISTEELKKMKFHHIKPKWRDFEAALQLTRPSQHMEFESKISKRHWKDIGGYFNIRNRMRQIVIHSLTRPETYTNIGVRPPSGMLLYGPSGCGKTALAEALLSESLVNVIQIKGPEVFSKYLGESERIIRRIFAQAKRIQPCVIFFDEMDAICSKRDWNSEGDSGIQERVLSTLLNEMDGIEERRGVFILGCTNRREEMDDALLRPGRLDQLIHIPLPTEEDRRDIIEKIGEKVPFDHELNIGKVVELTEGFTCADIEYIFREACFQAMRENTNINSVAMRHIKLVIQKTILNRI